MQKKKAQFSLEERQFPEAVKLRGTCGGVNVVSPFKLRHKKKAALQIVSVHDSQGGQSSLRSAEKSDGHSGFREQTAGRKAKRSEVTKTDLG